MPFWLKPWLEEKWKMVSASKFVFPPSPPYKLGFTQLGSGPRARLGILFAARNFVSLRGFSFRKVILTSRGPSDPGKHIRFEAKGHGLCPCLVRLKKDEPKLEETAAAHPSDHGV